MERAETDWREVFAALPAGSLLLALSGFRLVDLKWARGADLAAATDTAVADLQQALIARRWPSGLQNPSASTCPPAVS